ncbi:MAG: peptidylprolyl isomerase [Elusimicrobium sp.]|jgi:parvulin-like peptidyl-prolyl isomerase|nr:peptidylprolyl isomerase [Elusimicrobium sp.]
MKKILFAFLCLVIFVAACKKEISAPERPEGTLAEVGGVYITQGDMDNAVAAQTPQSQKYAKTSFGQEGVLDVLVREQLMTAAAKSNNIEQNPVYKNTIDGMQRDFDARLADAKKYNLIKILTDALRENGTIAVSQQEIDDYYKKYKYEITIRQMVIPSAQDAEAALRELNATPSASKQARFIELTKKYSVDPQADLDKGQLYTFIPGEYLPEIENAAANSPVNTVQGFIKTKRGFHIIYKVGEQNVTKKDAQGRIAKIIENQKLDKYLDGLTDKYKVEVYKSYED